MMAFIVPGLLTWSLGIAEVSLVPGRACANTWYSSDAGGMPEASSSEMRRYWLPIAPLMLAHSGLAGSSGGLSGSKAMWQETQLVPIRNGGSIAPSASRRTCESADRSEEHTSEIQVLMRISYADFCLQKTNITNDPLYKMNTT